MAKSNFSSRFGDGDIADCRIIFTGGDPERPVLPGGRHHVQFQTEAVGNQTGDIYLTAEQGFVVIEKTVSGGELRAATATVNFPGTAR